MEHIEQAGIHSGDSACSIPPYSLTKTVIDEILESTRRLALELGVKGLMNVQYAVKAGAVYVIEVNPRASRTVPFVSKAIGRPLAKLAALVMVGKTLAELGFTQEIWPRHFSVKEAVFPFVKFPGADTLLGPEMKSTGEVMGIDSDFGRAYAKAQIEAGNSLPAAGTVLVSVKLEDRAGICDGVRELASHGFKVLATPGTAEALRQLGVAVETVPKVGQGAPDVVQRIEAGDVDLVINTVGPEAVAVRDSASIRRAALLRSLPYFTTLAGARAAVGAIRALQLESIGVRALQDIHPV
jgi:carbamoyl-phosphate synthase large subunit